MFLYLYLLDNNLWTIDSIVVNLIFKLEYVNRKISQLIVEI